MKLKFTFFAFIFCTLIQAQNNGFLWNKSYGGSLDEINSRVTKTSDGNFVSLGTTYSNDGDIANTFQNSKIIITKIDSQTGNILWKKYPSFADNSEGYDIKLSNDGGMIVCGNESSFDDITSVLIKLNSVGETQWKRSFEGSDGFITVLPTIDGGYFLTGNGKIYKLDSIGNTEWTINFQSEFSYAIQLLNQNYIVANVENNKPTLTKLDPVGNIIWKKNYGDNILDCTIKKVILTNTNGFVMIGSSRTEQTTAAYDYSAIKTDEFGNLLWEKTFGGNLIDIGHDIQETYDGNFVISGMSRSLGGMISSPKGGIDIWLIKINNSGELVWEKSFGGTKDDDASYYYYGTAIETYNNEIVLSSFSKSNDDDVLTNKGGSDFWIFRINPELLSVAVDTKIPIDVYPNPFVSEIYVKGNIEISDVKVFDLSGKIVQILEKQNLKSGKINLQKLSSGVYFLSIHSTSGLNKVFKIKKN